LEFELLDHPTIRLTSHFTASFGGSAKANLEAASILDAFGRNTKISLRAPKLLPDEGMIETGAGLSEAVARRAVFMRRISEEIAAIEQHVGFEFEVPEQFEPEDVEAITNVASWLRGEEGSATLGYIVFEFIPAELAQRLDDLAAGEGEAQLPIEQTIFGRLVPVGLVEMKLPPMKVVETRPTANHPQAPIKVRMVPAVKDAARPFRLIRGGRLTRVFVPQPTIEVLQPAALLLTVPMLGDTLRVADALARNHKR
jgi:hypothetical protein